MNARGLLQKIEKLKPHVLKTASDTLQGYVFGCMVGVFSPSSRPCLRSMHESGKSFARVSMIYSATESVMQAYGSRDTPLNSLVSGAVAGGLGVRCRSKEAVLIGAASFGLYSGLSSVLSVREQK